MFRKFYKEVVVPAGLLTAMIVGAGMFSLPYLFSVSGFWTGISYLAAFAGVFSALHLMYAQIIKRAEGEHRFVGYAEKYLGNWGFVASMLTTVVGIILVLLIYLVLGAHFLTAIFPGLGELPAFFVFWALAAGSVILGIRRIADAGLFITALMVLIILWIFISGVRTFDAGSFAFSPAYFFVPYAAVLFSLSGRSAISSIHDYMRANKASERRLNGSIALGTFAPAVLYALFVVGVLGIVGKSVSVDAVSSLRGLSPELGVLMAVLGILSIWTSYIFLGLEVKNILMKDIRLRPFLAAVLISAVPAIMYLSGLKNFIALIGVSGGVLLALESILVILMWRKAVKPRPVLSLASFALVIILQLGIFYEVFFH